MLRTGQVAEAQLLVEMDCGSGSLVRLETEPAGAHALGYRDGELQQTAADTAAAGRFGDRHFGEFQFAGRRENQSAAANYGTVEFRNANLTARIENVGARIAENHAVRGLNREVLADPVLVQALEGWLIAGAEGAEQEIVHGHSMAHPGGGFYCVTVAPAC